MVANAENSTLRPGASKIVRETLFIIVIFGALAALYAFIATPVYRAEALLLPVDIEGVNGGSSLSGELGSLASLAGVGLGQASESRVEALATLQSRSFLNDFISNQGLRQLLFSDLWDESSSSWIDEEPTVNDAYDLFTNDVMAVRNISVSGLVVVQMDWRDAELAAKWANMIVEKANEVLRQRSSNIATASISFLEKELAATSDVSTQRSINALLEKQIHKIMIANVMNEFAFRVIDPAIAADVDDPVFPRKLLLICAGLAFGIMIAIGLFLLRSLIVIRL